MRTWHQTGHTGKTKQIRTLLRDYVLILANTGIRHGTESMKLKWNNIEEIERDGKKYIQMSVDGNTGQRFLIARHSVRRYLRRIQSRFDELKKLSDKKLYKVDENVFRLEDGTLPKDLYGAFVKLMDESKLAFDSAGSRRTLYSLRHTYATLQLLNGIDYESLRVNMGTSVQMLEQHYSHVVPKMVADKLAG